MLQLPEATEYDELGKKILEIGKGRHSSLKPGEKEQRKRRKANWG